MFDELFIIQNNIYIGEIMKSLIALLIFVFAIFNFSFANAEDGKRFALVIDQVEYSKLAKLDGARDEADQIASSLEKTGFEITRARNLSKDNLFNTLNDFRRKVAKTPGAIAFVYYTGHGAHNPGDLSTDNYLLGINADLQDPSDLPVFGV